jgi:hypothetical protein
MTTCESAQKLQTPSITQQALFDGNLSPRIDVQDPKSLASISFGGNSISSIPVTDSHSNPG